MKIKFYNYFVIATIFVIVGCEVKELDDNEMVYISDTQFNSETGKKISKIKLEKIINELMDEYL